MPPSKLMTQRIEKRPYLDLREFRSHFPVSDNTFRTWIRQGKVPPPIRRLGKLLWRRSVVEAFLRQLDSGKGEPRAR
jgi:predicted site-specific integrase-resolvase